MVLVVDARVDSWFIAVILVLLFAFFIRDILHQNRTRSRSAQTTEPKDGSLWENGQSPDYALWDSYRASTVRLRECQRPYVRMERTVRAISSAQACWTSNFLFGEQKELFA